MILPIFSAFLGTILFIRLLRPVAFRVGLLARPGGHRRHESEIPLTGGLAIYLGITLTLLLGIRSFPLPIFLAASLVMIFGLADDRWMLPYWIRFVVQIAASLIMIFMGNVSLSDLGYLTSVELFNLGRWSNLLTIFATVGVINAVNMVDGMDGLAGSLMVVSLSAVIFFMLIQPEHMLLLPVIIIASVSGFLLFNGRFFGRDKAAVFMGDAGSMMLGVIVAWLLIQYSQQPERLFPPVVALWMVAIPLLDSVGVLLRRPVRGLSPFKADRLHTHHLLLRAGFSVNQTLVVLTAVAIMLVIVAIFAHLNGVPDSYLFFGFLTLFGIYLLLMEVAHRRVQ